MPLPPTGGGIVIAGIVVGSIVVAVCDSPCLVDLLGARVVLLSSTFCAQFIGDPTRTVPRITPKRACTKTASITITTTSAAGNSPLVVMPSLNPIEFQKKEKKKK